MPYKVKGKCVYKKATGKKVGCTKGSVKKYLAALHINAKESVKTFKEYYYESYGLKVTDDTTATAEGVYAQGQDEVPQPGGYDTNGIMTVDQPLTNEASKKQRDNVIDKIVRYLNQFVDKDCPVEGPDSGKFIDTLKKIAKALEEVGIEPVDVYATIQNPKMAQQYLIRGPSAPGGGGKGALKDLQDIKAGLLSDDESNPGGPTDNAAVSQGIQGENFINGKGPGRPGDSKRHGIKKGSSLSSLDKIVHSKTASPRKKQLAHWQANMRRGKAKKK